jgi:cytochrome c biogenesis protein CcmG, thiol:disulfide interchange protein DsbE
MSDDAIVVDPQARFPRPVALVIVGAIALATLVALAWPALPFNEGRRIVLGPTKVGVIMRQVDSAGAAARVGSPAPDFEWVRPDGTRASLASLRGRGVVINFWATWCEPCKKEMPLMDRTAAEHPAVAWLAVDLDEDGERIRAFFDRAGVTRLEPLLDVDLTTTQRYVVLSVPSTFFVDSGGTIRHVKIGEMSEADLRAGLERIK